jgi:hypothetical protein
MSSGFEVYNSSGILQFTSEQKPFNLVDKITFNTASVGTPRTVGGNTGSRPISHYVYGVTVSRPNSIIALQGLTDASVMFQNGRSVGIGFTRTGYDLTVYAFAPGAANPNAPSYGLELYDGAGNMTFNAHDKPLKPVFFKQFTAEDGDNGQYEPLNFSGDPGRTYAVVPNRLSTYGVSADDSDRRINNINVVFFQAYNSYVYGRSVTLNRIRVGNAEGNPPELFGINPGSATVIDVTYY